MKSVYLILLINLIFVFARYQRYQLTEKDKELLPNPKDREKFEKYLKKLELIERYMDPTRILEEGDTSESGDSESESESGESESESESESGESGDSETTTPGNQTVTEPEVTVPARPPEPNRSAKVTLVSFNSFSAPKTKQKSRKPGANPNKDVYWIDFLIRLFFSVDVPVPPKKVKMALFVSSVSGLRSLQNSEDVDAECIIDDADKEKKGNSTVKYNCQAESEVEPEKVQAREELTFFQNVADTTPVNDLQGGVTFTSQAYDDATDLSNAPETSHFATLYGIVEGKDTYFVISGSLDSEGDDTAIETLQLGNDIKFTFYDNSANPALKHGKRALQDLEDRKQEMTCKVTSKEQNDYKIRCDPEKAFQGNLHRAVGNVDKTSLMLDLEQGKDSVSVDPSRSSQKNPTYYRKNSSGLSGGAIAGIVIACAAALIIATILALALKGPKAPVASNSSIVGLKTDDFQG